MRCITVRIVTHPVRKAAASAVLEALRAAGLEGAFLVRETAPGVVELQHNARRESSLHVRTDLFEARRALTRAGFDPFEFGSSIVAQKATPPDARPPLAKATLDLDSERSEDGVEDGVEDGGESGRDSKTRVA